MKLRKKLALIVAAMSMGVSAATYAHCDIVIGPSSCDSGFLYCAPFGPDGSGHCSFISCTCLTNEQ